MSKPPPKFEWKPSRFFRATKPRKVLGWGDGVLLLITKSVTCDKCGKTTEYLPSNKLRWLDCECGNEIDIRTDWLKEKDAREAKKQAKLEASKGKKGKTE